MKNPGWEEVESKIYYPDQLVTFVFGLFFLVAGVCGLFGLGPRTPAGVWRWGLIAGAGCFATMGLMPIVIVLRRMFQPGTIRHAVPEVLTDVPKEPLIREGSVVTGGVYHELIEEPEGWNYRPDLRQLRTGQWVYWGFAISFLVVLAGIVSWSIQDALRKKGRNWPVAIALGIGLTVVGGGTAFAWIHEMIKTVYQRLCRLKIPRDGRDLELDIEKEPESEFVDPTEWLSWSVVEDEKRRVLRIPKSRVQGVQLCAWKFETSSETTWAVQGLLVLGGEVEGCFLRVPILLTSDHSKGSLMMRKLAKVLEVPFLFCALPEDFEAEKERAKTRPRLKLGGIQC